jgi:hypothetical protein
MNLIEAKNIIAKYGYKLKESELPKPGDIYFSHQEHDGIDNFWFYIIKDFKGQTGKLQRIDHEGGGMWNPTAIPDPSKPEGEIITKRFNNGSFSLDKWHNLHKYSGEVKANNKKTSLDKESDEIEKAKLLLAKAGYKVLKETSDSYLQGKASPDYNESSFRFGNGEGGFPADSDLGRAYALYTEGMTEEDLAQVLYEKLDLDDEEAQDTAYELFYKLDIAKDY